MSQEQYCILCIDDKPEMCHLVESILSRQGYEVLVALDAYEGIELIQTQRPDLVLLDIMLPEVDGSEVFYEMKKHPGISEIPIIIISALDQHDEVVRSLIPQTEGYIKKPFIPADLINEVNRILKSNS